MPLKPIDVECQDIVLDYLIGYGAPVPINLLKQHIEGLGSIKLTYLMLRTKLSELGFKVIDTPHAFHVGGGIHWSKVLLKSLDELKSCAIVWT